MKALGRTYPSLAAETGISETRLRGIVENGRRLSFEDAAVIADALGVDLTVLTHGNEENAVGIPEIAGLLKMSHDSIYRMARGGDIPGFKARGVWRFFPSKVVAHLEAPKDPWAQSSRSRSRKRVA